ncbi:M3 family oligoendopeptidase, partial [Enterococcus faecalis]
KKQTNRYHQMIDQWAPQSEAGASQLAEILTIQGTITDGFTQCNSFITALNSANTSDSKAKLLVGQLASLLPEFQLAETIFTKKLTNIPAKQW